MKRENYSLTADVLFVFFCMFVRYVHSLNYGYPVYQPRYQPAPMESGQSPIARPPPLTSSTNATTDAEARKKPSSPNSSYIFIYPLTFPQSRGGKNLNLTLGSILPKEEPRIMNRPDLYPNFAVPRLISYKVPQLSRSPPKRPFTPDNQRTPQTSKSAPAYSENPVSYQPLENSSNKDIRDPIFPTLPDEEPRVSNKNIREPKTFQLENGGNDNQDSGFPPASMEEPPQISGKNARQPQAVRYPQIRPQINKSSYIPPAFISPKNYKNANYAIYRYKIPTRLYQPTTPPPRQQENTEPNWPCFCVPYYLCKNGVINSGGRSVATIRRKGRSLLTYNLTNKAYSRGAVEPKVMNAYVVEQESEPTLCEDNKVCCRLSFEEDEKDDTDKYYPVATPIPEPYYPNPPRFPDTPKQYGQCGIRRAYGIQARLKQIQYPADVSEFGEYPWQVAVLKKNKGEKSLYLCGGVLISSLWVATAGHCIKKEQFSPLLIRLGEWDVNRKDEVYPYIEIEADSIILHPDFNPDTLFNDIALIRMKSPVDPRLPHVAPACLPKRTTVYEDTRCWVSGWGKDFFGPEGEYQNILKEVDLPVLGRDLCNTALRSTNLGSDFTLDPGFICAGGEAGKDACTGDGGSPLVCTSGQKWYVVGIVSWGIGCGQPGIPGIYVNMLYYIDWINSIIWR